MRKCAILLVLVATYTIQLFAQNTIAAKDAGKYIGEKVTVCGKIPASSTVLPNKTSVFQLTTNSGATLQIAVRSEDKKNFNNRPEDYLYNKSFCVTGSMVDANGKPELVLRRPDDIKPEETSGGADFRPFDIDILNRFFFEE